ncbi:Transcription factor tau subunit sfc7 [Neolecta irregularis DAH-3]|uniref:Transcription factor tau subunit sfc7 n=1 Tax=Neolecta irregularis (strain DAH-3) TaxID=1198029 RepID=A0A1U7LJX0_NEOID|nr:Transcription factor tau subunit sfc7 [Neolecta irregularis DAH-3]|eukprot:OLL22821.1 Transcription factor tau subunit sfc7 [Neolecta irregularis DAH-3]
MTRLTNRRKKEGRSFEMFRADIESPPRKLGQQGLDLDYEEETFYITVDLGPNAPKLSDVRDFSLIGLNESPNPILRVGGFFYQGKWAESVGTDIFIERIGEEGTIVGTTKHRLVMEPVKIEPKERKEPIIASAPGFKKKQRSSGKRKSSAPDGSDTAVDGVPDCMISTWKIAGDGAKW